MSETTATAEYTYPNKMGRIVLTAMEDIMGRHGVNAVLNLAKLPHLVDNYPPSTMAGGFTFAELGAIQATLDVMYGHDAGRGLALRAGRETWKYGVREFAAVMGIADLAFRALPLSIKMKIGLDVFAETFNKFTDQVVRVRDESDRFLWIIERCPVCWERRTKVPCCFLAVGLLEEATHWVSNGRHFDVREVSCIAAGDATCTIAIKKKPRL